MSVCDVAEGKLEVFQHNKLLTWITVWTTFGELAILYNCTRTASVRGELPPQPHDLMRAFLNSVLLYHQLLLRKHS